MVKTIALLIRTDMHVGNPCFIVANSHECIFQLNLAVTNGFDFGALQNDTGFNRFFNKKIMIGFFILCNNFPFSFWPYLFTSSVAKRAAYRRSTSLLFLTFATLLFFGNTFIKLFLLFHFFFLTRL